VTVLTVETRRRADAACIARAFDAAVSRSSRGWLVTLEIDSSSDLGRFLATLQSCLDEDAIPMVTVALDGDRYVMEGLNGGRSGQKISRWAVERFRPTRGNRGQTSRRHHRRQRQQRATRPTSRLHHLGDPFARIARPLYMTRSAHFSPSETYRFAI
jgi:hypothetical protein